MLLSQGIKGKLYIPMFTSSCLYIFRSYFSVNDVKGHSTTASKNIYIDGKLTDRTFQLFRISSKQIRQQSPQFITKTIYYNRVLSMQFSLSQ